VLLISSRELTEWGRSAFCKSPTPLIFPLWSTDLTVNSNRHDIILYSRKRKARTKMDTEQSIPPSSTFTPGATQKETFPPLARKRRAIVACTRYAIFAHYLTHRLYLPRIGVVNIGASAGMMVQNLHVLFVKKLARQWQRHGMSNFSSMVFPAF
jgi:hypothetical protein